MTRRKTHEQLAMTRTKSRVARIQKLIEELSYDWYDSECHSISTAADELGCALANFEQDAKDLWAEYLQLMAENHA